ncbi:hypothetical protein ACQKMI_10605 [Lysinibacillus sp. NPDC097214]|uniref:hypothetical protein n=1 Tax=Lysinibacillus sp. NPDC097214 TaxID=3390584 RepID=UPI003CFDF552
MLERYVSNYMEMLKDTFDSLDELNGDPLYAGVKSEYLDIKEVKTALVNEISKYYGMKKPEVNKLLVVEEFNNEK